MPSLPDIFLYNPEKPLIFTQLYFWIFYFLVLVVYSVIYRERALRNAFLFAASLFFYWKTSGLFFLLLVFSTVSDYYLGNLIYRAKHRGWKKFGVFMSVFINLFMLSYFKYTYLFVDTINNLFNLNLEVVNHLALWSNQLTGTHFDITAIILPVGISFYTFQTISYTVDIYRGKVDPVRHILDFGFYVSFFPQLVAGPIVRASEFIPQLYKRYHLTREAFGYALFLILKGLFKKIFIGDYIAVNFIDRIFANPVEFSGFENLMALYGYSLQVYVDFSGYTDIATGVALLLGFRLPVNFNSPYKATSVANFWKRWHISLSSWLRDYLYIPLGGNRKGRIRTDVNLMITMLLGGLWHGASWQFMVWGGLNGIGIVVYKLWSKISPYEKSNHWLVRLWKIFLTFNFITFTRIWFRSESMEKANQLMQQVAHEFNAGIIPDVLWSYRLVFMVMALGYVTHWIPSKWKLSLLNGFIGTAVWVKVVITVLVVFIIYQAYSADLQPFIYFQF
ncbi:MAG: MBOAT family protein [Bacteroidales bacterium]|nr:MBOAT family protein [Bacteroidales bacterium]MBN2699413.1 MBOAT family protein [Bacteroidales bacterium]